MVLNVNLLQRCLKNFLSAINLRLLNLTPSCLASTQSVHLNFPALLLSFLPFPSLPFQNQEWYLKILYIFSFLLFILTYLHCQYPSSTLSFLPQSPYLPLFSCYRYLTTSEANLSPIKVNGCLTINISGRKISL